MTDTKILISQDGGRWLPHKKKKAPPCRDERSSKNLESRWGNAQKHYKSTGCIKHEACAPLLETRPLRKSVGFTL